jgi:hypothetical protein
VKTDSGESVMKPRSYVKGFLPLLMSMALSTGALAQGTQPINPACPGTSSLNNAANAATSNANCVQPVPGALNQGTGTMGSGANGGVMTNNGRATPGTTIQLKPAGALGSSGTNVPGGLKGVGTGNSGKGIGGTAGAKGPGD